MASEVGTKTQLEKKTAKTQTMSKKKKNKCRMRLQESEKVHIEYGDANSDSLTHSI